MHNLNNLPPTPGVYIFRDHNKKVLYVGKAINLKNRVSSYFNNLHALQSKTKALVEHIDKIDYIKVNNEVESLLLEAELIKRYKPPYNVNLKDDKFYKYIKVEKRLDGLYTVSTARDENDKKAIYFGPFPESTSINIILKTLRRIFPYKDCSDTKFTRYQRLNRPCLYGYIGVCPAPCIKLEAREVNNDNVKKIMKYLKGDRKKLFDKIRTEMLEASQNLDFEKAAYLRDQVNAYEYITSTRRDIKEYTINPNLVDDVTISGVTKLIKHLSNLGFTFENTDELNNFRIEVFDISNFQGKNAVGSMVVLTGGNPDKKEYRRFKIRSKDTPDDFSMMKEMLRRRFKRTREGKYKNVWRLPDLIVIDGGKGQLSVALSVLDEYKIDIPIIGLAKKHEEIVYNQNDQFKILQLEDSDSGLNIIKRGRDEAHRFGITYYKKLHQKNLFNRTQK